MKKHIIALHSTMFLLIPYDSVSYIRYFSLFTFHNVSINTKFCKLIRISHFNFTFHNVSINTVDRMANDQNLSNFTFHNVSINTELEKPQLP